LGPVFGREDIRARNSNGNLRCPSHESTEASSPQNSPWKTVCRCDNESGLLVTQYELVLCDETSSRSELSRIEMFDVSLEK
jgi:hypothetical protein